MLYEVITDIIVINGETEQNAKAIDIDDEARLVVILEDGETKALNTGEVSVREKYNLPGV